MAIVEFTCPGIMWQKCIYAPQMPQWSTWEKLIVVDHTGTLGISDLFWEYQWFPLAEGMSMAELEATVRQLYPEFPEGVYEIHRMGAP